jgi:octaprenyl-diphosphate synthase
MTLPVIISLEASNLEEKSFWIKTIENLDQSSNDLNKAIELINKYNGITSTLALAKKYSMEAIKSLEIFPQSEAKLALESLASIAVNRKK